jgi:putative nucleotidyltransferase with HDIG domain
MPLPTRDQALALLAAHVTSEYVVRHSLATEAILRALARRLGHDEDLWGIAGLLHDLDYDEVGGDPKRHALRTIEILAPLDPPREMLDAIKAHNGDELGVPCKAPLDFAVTAGESVTGLVFAMAMVLPSKALADVKASSIRKRIREPRFAANVSRERVGQYAGLGLTEEEFLGIAVEAMKGTEGQRSEV